MSTTFNFPAETARPSTDERCLVNRHFLGQALLPSELREVDLADLDPLLRLLLFSDGSITRALVAHHLDRVEIDLVDEAPLATAPAAASELLIDPGQESIRRRVTMSFESTPEGVPPSGFAESHLVPERLPPRFLQVLRSSPAGIGDALSATHLEARRELLWFGLGQAPPWVPSLRGESLVRSYRIVVGGAPTILVREGFGIRLKKPRYTLALRSP